MTTNGKHDKTPMEQTGKHRRAGIWYIVYQCPACGRRIQPPKNPSRGKAFYCSGSRRRDGVGQAPGTAS